MLFYVCVFVFPIILDDIIFTSRSIISRFMVISSIIYISRFMVDLHGGQIQS